MYLFEKSYQDCHKWSIAHDVLNSNHFAALEDKNGFCAQISKGKTTLSEMVG